MNRLGVQLGATAVGVLECRAADTCAFRLLPEYLALPSRPVLGQLFEDDLRRVHRATLHLPAFFSNLLPEGPLRKLLARRAAVHEEREVHLLLALRDDLPGAVAVQRIPASAPLENDGRENGGGKVASPPEAVAPLKFSLAGVQLKFSVLSSGGRLTLPASGQGGQWIVKLPDPDHPRVPENEFSMLLWAAAAGIAVPESRLVSWRDVEGLPPELNFREETALLVRRFDRAAGQRVHQEDFAQVLGLYPHEKYSRFNYETIARIVHAVAGPEALDQLVRRLVFMVLSGNGDAHHKNWALLYPDGRTAVLAPAYDLVFTRAYLEHDRLALNFGGAKEFRTVTLDTFRRLAGKLEVCEERVEKVAGEAAAGVRDRFAEVAGDLRLPPGGLARLRRHLAAMRL